MLRAITSVQPKILGFKTKLWWAAEPSVPRKPFKELVQVMHIFADATSVLDFNDCLSAIDNSFVQSASNHSQPSRKTWRNTPYSPKFPTDSPRNIIEATIRNSIYTKVNNQSCFETKLNALKTLENGHKLINVRNGQLLMASLIGIWKMFWRIRWTNRKGYR